MAGIGEAASIIAVFKSPLR